MMRDARRVSRGRAWRHASLVAVFLAADREPPRRHRRQRRMESALARCRGHLHDITGFTSLVETVAPDVLGGAA